MTFADLLQGFASYAREWLASSLDPIEAEAWAGCAYRCGSRRHLILVRPVPLLLPQHPEDHVILLARAPEPFVPAVGGLFI